MKWINVFRKRYPILFTQSLFILSICLILVIFGIYDVCKAVKYLADQNLLTPLVIFISSFLSLTGIALSLISNRKVVKERETMSFLFDRSNDDAYVSGVNAILSMMKKGESIRALSTKENQTSDNSKHVKYVLNHLELLSAGINKNILSEEILIEASIGSTLDLYKALSGYIDDVRERKKRYTLYDQFESVCIRWKDIQIKRNNKVRKSKGLLDV